MQSIVLCSAFHTHLHGTTVFLPKTWDQYNQLSPKYTLPLNAEVSFKQCSAHWISSYSATCECIFYSFEECFKILTQERRSAWMFYVSCSSKSNQICCCQISSALRCVFEYQCLIFWMVCLATVIFLYAQSYLHKCAKINDTLYLTNIYISIKTPLKMMRKILHSHTHTH